MSEWRPIETAPDETFVLAYGGSDLCGWSDGINLGIAKRRGLIWFDNEAESITKPTHWMPLPEPPK